MVTNNGIDGHTEFFEGSFNAGQEIHIIPHHIARKEYRCGVSRITILAHDEFDMWYNLSLKGNHLLLGLRLWITHNNKIKSPILALLRQCYMTQNEHHKGLKQSNNSHSITRFIRQR